MSPPPPQQSRDVPEWVATVEELLTTTRPGTFSAWCAEVSGRLLFAHEADRPHYAASTMKLPLLVAAYRLHERGVLDLDAAVRVHNEFRSALDARPFSVSQEDDQDDETWARTGGLAPLRTLARHAIVHSGNLATNLVLEQVGAEEVAAVLRDAGCSPTTRVPRGIEDAAAREAGLDNTVTAADLGRVMAGIGARTLAGEETCRDVEAVLAGQQYRDMVPAGLPAGTYVANKTGWVTGVAHDVALVRPDSRPAYVLSVCTTSELSEDEANGLVAAVSERIWTGLVGALPLETGGRT